eukprot:TRINITY_DN23815_c0_g1_i1.p2 TRINITY_DN23815_c0_g1~~TRINITY_DN23815_c0_g1_i1.p2  ORF type:complete len:134 (+),score=18.15 TRINITY_DN23815_c0_g1_i1:117-518(+)
MAAEVTHRGGCHCGTVKYEVEAPAVINAIDCNCSVCYMKGNLHFIVPESKFRLLQGEGDLSCYQFNTKIAKHLFCKHCGVQSFYRPRSNPDGVGINPRCLDPSTVEKIVISTFDGQNWEQSIDDKIRNLSKVH